MYISLETLYDIYKEHPSICTDSRRVEAGCLFIALRGERFDGNAYAPNALADGAAYALVSDPSLQGDRYLLVEDTLATLQALARLHRERMGIPVIAITGTNGKTTTKELTATVLQQSYRLLYTEGNLNNHIGLPLTLLRLRAEHQLALVEMGASKPGDIAKLCAIALPDYGIITNVGAAHLEGFGSLEGVARTKGELYDYLRGRSGAGGIIFRHADDELLQSLASDLPALLYGGLSASPCACSAPAPEAQEAHSSARSHGTACACSAPAPDAQEAHSSARSHGTACATPQPKRLAEGYIIPSDEGDDLLLGLRWHSPSLGIGWQSVRTQLVGGYNLSNALCAIAVGLYFDVPTPSICSALEGYRPSNSRSQLVQGQRNRLVVDAYNANPSSMSTAVRNLFASAPSVPHLLILGDMNELGSESHQAHLELYHLVQSLIDPQRDRVLYCGPIWQRVLEGYGARSYPSAEALATALEAERPEGYLVLIKGSNSLRLTTLPPLL